MTKDMFEHWKDIQRLEDAANLSLRNASERKVRLFLVACGGLLPEPRHEQIRAAFEVAARYADGQATHEELTAMNDSLEQAALPGVHLASNATSRNLYPAEGDGDGWTSFCAGGSPSDFGIWNLLDVVGRDNPRVLPPIEGIVEDLTGDLSLSTGIAHRWDSPEVVELARSMYQERCFNRMAKLADVLVDAGCDDVRVLAHCRGPQGHVQGCWVIDRILGLDPPSARRPEQST